MGSVGEKKRMNNKIGTHAGMRRWVLFPSSRRVHSGVRWASFCCPTGRVPVPNGFCTGTRWVFFPLVVDNRNSPIPAHRSVPDSSMSGSDVRADTATGQPRSETDGRMPLSGHRAPWLLRRVQCAASANGSMPAGSGAPCALRWVLFPYWTVGRVLGSDLFDGFCSRTGG